MLPTRTCTSQTTSATSFKFGTTYCMDILVRMNVDELNQSFLDFINQSLKSKRIALHIYEDQMDETEYLLSDPVHKEKLLKSVVELNEQKGLETYKFDKLKTMFLNEIKS